MSPCPQEVERLAASLDGARTPLLSRMRAFSPAGAKLGLVEAAEAHARRLDHLAHNLSRCVGRSVQVEVGPSRPLAGEEVVVPGGSREGHRWGTAVGRSFGSQHLTCPTPMQHHRGHQPGPLHPESLGGLQRLWQHPAGCASRRDRRQPGPAAGGPHLGGEANLSGPALPSPAWPCPARPSPAPMQHIPAWLCPASPVSVLPRAALSRPALPLLSHPYPAPVQHSPEQPSSYPTQSCLALPSPAPLHLSPPPAPPCVHRRWCSGVWQPEPGSCWPTAVPWRRPCSANSSAWAVVRAGALQPGWCDVDCSAPTLHSSPGSPTECCYQLWPWGPGGPVSLWVGWAGLHLRAEGLLGH